MARVLACAGVVGLVMIAGSIGADAVGEAYPMRTPERTSVVCIRHDGSTYSPRCVMPKGHGVTCNCGSDFHVAEPYCNPKEQPAPSTADANRARYAAATKGSLKYAKYQGLRFCVPDPYAATEPKWPDLDNGVGGVPRPPCCGGV